MTNTGQQLSMPVNGIGLYGIYPNPVTNELTARYYLPKNGKAVFSIIDIEGKIVGKLNLSDQPGGFSNQRFSTANLAPGIYMLKLTTGNETSVMKFTKF